MNRTVKVTGFSLRPSTKLKLSGLFSRVGQVQKVYLSPDKNAAFVRFEYKSAVSFVLEQEWSIGREVLKVRPLVSAKEPSPPRLPQFESCKSECQQAETPSCYTYNDYCSTRNSLWVDFPHERFGAVPSKKRKRKRRDEDCLLSCVPQAAKHPKKGRKKKPKKKRCAYLESAASLPFGISTQVSEDPRQVFLKGHTTVPLLVPVTATAKDVLALASDATHVPSQYLHITVESRGLSDEVVRDIQEGSTLHYTIKGLGGADSGGTEDVLKKKAEELKDDGNKMYSEKKYEAAAALYSASIELFPLVPAYNNRAQCYLLLSQWEKCIHDCDQVLQNEPENMKALLRRGKARKSRGEFSLARRDLTTVREKGPSSLSEDAIHILQELELEQSDQLPTDEGQLSKDGSEQELSKSARKKLRKKAMKKNQERLQDAPEQKSAIDEQAEEAKLGTDDAKVVADAGNQRSASQAIEVSAETHELVTGKMDASRSTQSESTHAAGLTVTPTSSVEDVRQWLQVTCGVTESCLRLLEGLDGEVLFEYGGNITMLVDTTKIPVGVARKITFLRDNPSYQSTILTWDVKKVIEFVGEFCQGHDWSKVEENSIDGPAFLSYKSAEEISQDFKVKKMIAFHIFSARQNFFSGETKRKENSECNPGVVHQQNERCDENTDESQGTLQTVPCSSGIEEQRTTTLALKKDDPFTPYKLHLQNVLHLQPLNTSGSQSLTLCELRVVYHKRKDLNNLEKLFMFLILCKPEFCKGKSGKDACEKLWRLITDDDNVSSKWTAVLPEHMLKTLTVENNRVLFDGKALSFDNQAAKLSNIIEFDRTVRKLDQCCTPVMIIDRELLMRGPGYVLTLKLDKTTCSFPFGFHDGQQYWLFSSADFGWGFERQTIDASVLGTLQRCSFSDSIHIGTTSDSNVEEQQCHQIAEEHDEKCGEQVLSVHPPVEVNSAEMSTSLQGEGFMEEERFSVSTGPDQVKVESENDEHVKRIKPRPFKQSNWKYSQGVLRAVESGDNMLSRAVEFKFQAGCPPEDDKALRSFLYKSLEFVCACLNARKNGTIYFGISEETQGFKYGEIRGIEMDQKLCAMYYGAFYNEFVQKCFPSCFELVKLCLTGPVFVPVGNTTKHVIEIDIESDYEQTKQTLFYFDPKCICDKYGDFSKDHVYPKNKNKWTGIFRRDGSETKYIKKSERQTFEMTVLPELCKKRCEAERKSAQACKVNMNSPEADKLKQFISACDDRSVFPILVLPKLSEEEKRNAEFFDFIYYIRWSAIFDFDNDSVKNGVYSIAKSTNLAFEVHESIASDFKDMTVEARKDSLSFPKKTVWLFMNGKTTGDNTFERVGQKQWKNLYWTYLQNAVAFYKDNTVISPERRLVLILISDETEDGIMEASQDVKTAFSWRRVFFVFQSQSVREIFAEELSDDLYEHSVVMPWNHVRHIICQCLKLKSQDEDKYVRTSSGADVPIPFSEWQSWSDLDILNVKECQREWDGFTRDQRNSNAQEEEKKFYEGKPVSWWNFFFTDFGYNHVMNRDIFSNLKHHIEGKLSSAENDSDSTPVVTISHMPGAGGTTLGKHLLWQLRKQCKCAVLKNITLDTERQVAQFWESVEGGQDQMQLPPVVLLADNLSSESSQLTESELCRRLYRHQKEMQLMRPLAILIHCNRTMKLKGKYQLPQRLSKDEQDWMEIKSKKLQEEHPDGIGTMIAFLALRDGFDQSALQDHIVQYLDQNVLNENEQTLIEYVSLITAYFPLSKGSPGLPVTCFDSLMRNFKDEMAKMCWENTLSETAKVILVIEYSPRNTVRIANQPYAKAVLQTSLKKNSQTLSDVVLRCLQSRLVSGSSHSQKEVIEILTQMILERRIEEVPTPLRQSEDTPSLTPMSPLIMDIKETDFTQAVGVLKVGYEKLDNEAFNQQLARLYMLYDKLDEALKFAQLAVSHLPDKKEFKHTLGMVYLRKFNKLNVTVSESDSISEPLKIANMALTNFMEAQGNIDEDAVGFCFAYSQTIHTVNQILQFLLRMIPVGKAHQLGRYLTEENFCAVDLFDNLQDTERQAMKTLLKEGIEALRVMFYVAYSNNLGKSERALRSSKDKITLSNVPKWCEKYMATLARCIGQLRLRRVSTSVCENTPKDDNSLRIRNVQLKGCFFESIFLQVMHLDKTKKDWKKNEIKDALHEIQTNLVSIREKSYSDMDNLMTVYLARELLGEEFSFTSNKSQIYGFCNKIIRSDLQPSDPRRMRAHLFLVLVSWPRQYWEGFHPDEFRRSFQHKSPALTHKKEPFLPKVYFYITRDSERFHLWHWPQMQNETDTELPPPDAMNRRLQIFSGDYKVKEICNERKSRRIEMKLKFANSELNLTISKIRGKDVFTEKQVQFYLGFSMYGPVAIIHSILAD